MIFRRAAAVSLFLLQVQGAPGTTDRSPSRTLKIPAGPGRPAVEIRVHRDADQGIVEVFTPAGGLVESLSCTVALPSYFEEQFVIEDLDMDGNPDLRGVRGFGAKWQRHCIWLFDPSSGLFENDFLAKQMELLTNLEVDAAHHRLISSTIGPVRPTWDTETERRLVPPGDNRRAQAICDALGGG